MKAKALAELSDQELLQEARKQKSTSMLNALLIGFLAGIVVFSFMKSTLGLLTLIPLYFAYKLISKAKPDTKELDSLLKARNLK